jgi:hypothetical protein
MNADHIARELAKIFQHEAKKIHEKMDYPSWREVKFTLELRYTPDDPKYHIECATGGMYVKASNLDALIKEVSRRLNFEDVESAKIDMSLKALPAPECDNSEYLDDEVPF